jgi:hypothetical protein
LPCQKHCLRLVFAGNPETESNAGGNSRPAPDERNDSISKTKDPEKPWPSHRTENVSVKFDHVPVPVVPQKKTDDRTFSLAVNGWFFNHLIVKNFSSNGLPFFEANHRWRIFCVSRFIAPGDARRINHGEHGEHREKPFWPQRARRARREAKNKNFGFRCVRCG